MKVPSTSQNPGPSRDGPGGRGGRSNYRGGPRGGRSNANTIRTPETDHEFILGPRPAGPSRTQRPISVPSSIQASGPAPQSTPSPRLTTSAPLAIPDNPRPVLGPRPVPTGPSSKNKRPSPVPSPGPGSTSRPGANTRQRPSAETSTGPPTKNKRPSSVPSSGSASGPRAESIPPLKASVSAPSVMEKTAASQSMSKKGSKSGSDSGGSRRGGPSNGQKASASGQSSLPNGQQKVVNGQQNQRRSKQFAEALHKFGFEPDTANTQEAGSRALRLVEQCIETMTRGEVVGSVPTGSRTKDGRNRSASQLQNGQEQEPQMAPEAIGGWTRERKPKLAPYRGLKDDEYKKYHEVPVFIGPGLKNETIMDIFRSLKDYGPIESIRLLTNNTGSFTGKALVIFKSVRCPFWQEEEGIEFGFGKVAVKWNRPTKSPYVQSKINRSKFFVGKMEFDVRSLEFGFMLKPEEFMVMYSSTPDLTNITWEVNLFKRKISITYTMKKTQEQLKAVDSDSDQVKNASQVEIHKYMIEIPFSHLQGLLTPADEDQDADIRTFVMPLPNPPKCFRQLVHWSETMNEIGQMFWNIEDTWARQTDVEYDMKARDKEPVSLRHKKPIIDLGRWTTYRLEFKLKTPEKKAEFKSMMSALKEYNIQAQPLTNFNVNRDRSALTQVWDFLDTDPSFGDYNLSYPVRYQLESCISHGFINEHNITQQFLEELRRLHERTAVILLEAVAEAKKRIYDPMEVFNLPRDHRLAIGRVLPEFCVYMQRATVTPTGIHFHTPSVEISNRVIRQFNYFSNRFIRVSFSDEEHIGRLRPSDRITSNELYRRIWRTLLKGIVIGDRKFEFLAFGNSQLREHGAYFFASDGKITCDVIRDWMGDFSDIPYIAKYAARLGQCFSTTKPFKLKTYVPIQIDDVERNGYTFTDGVGKISPLLATLITQKMQKNRPTDSYQSSCFQYRLGGCKGILVSWPDLPKKSMQIRKSQVKFWSEHAELEIIRCSQFSAASLNRQLIIVLSNLGAPDQYFRDRLSKVLKDYNEAIHRPSKALEILTKYIDPNFMTLRVADLVRGGFMQSQEPFVISVLHLWRAWTMKYLKEKAKIVLEHGAFLLGCTDETQTLRGWYENDKEDDLAQIFCQIWDNNSKPPGPRVITGRCVVARNPSLHPGDVRIVEAVDVPALHHLIDVVVFPQTGDRDIPNMLSGGDLDGDDYVVIWDKELVKPGVVKNEPPANYTSNDARKADGPVTITDVKKFFIDYLKNDRLGSIANAHLAHADHQEAGVKSAICLELAQLHSDAVDFPKSGVKATMSKKHRVQEWPHFMEKPEEEGQRISDKILGQLYQMVERVEFVPQYNLKPNEAIMNAFELTDEEMQWARKVKTSYDKDMRRIMSQHNINTEFEVWSTFVMSHSAGNDYKFHETIGEHSATLMDRYREIILDSCKDRTQELPRKVAALYVYTQNHIEEGKKYLLNVRVETTPKLKGKELDPNWTKTELAIMPLMSCPWLFADILMYISKGQLKVQNDYEPGKPPVFKNWLNDEDDVEKVTIEDLEKLGEDLGGLVMTEETDSEDEKEKRRQEKGKGKAVDVGSFDNDDDDDDDNRDDDHDNIVPLPKNKRKENTGFDALGNDVDFDALEEKLKEMEFKWEDLE